MFSACTADYSVFGGYSGTASFTGSGDYSTSVST